MAGRLARADRYSIGAIWFHWSIAALVIVNLAIGLFHESLFEGIKGLMPIHKAIGITVLALTIGRIVWRLTNRPPPMPIATPGWQRVVAHGNHLGLYGLMLAMPLTGWMMVSTGKLRPLTWFGLFDIPYLPVTKAVGDAAHDGHELLGYLMAALVVLHVAAALYHHMLLRDSVLPRMAPGLRRR